MPYLIACSKGCSLGAYATNIVDLITNHRDNSGWFLCRCGERGYIKKSFNLQEVGEVWEPYLQGIITLGDEGDTYQPFVFKVSYSPNAPTDSLWFSYYKDLRSQGGVLKLGYGPGGPPVLHRDSIIELMQELYSRGIMSDSDIDKIRNI